jgi:ABC-2 type transport system ATP-binding protein
MIEIEGVVKHYNGTRALDGFSLEVHAGEMFGLVGPNGAGKTTLIKVLATLIAPQQGRARVGGHDVQREPHAVRRLVGYMPDVPGLYHDMRVAEFLGFFADAFHLKGAQRRRAIEAALERCGLEERRDEFVEQLSLGMKQRLVLAKTLLHEPGVLLLDEPATGLDPLARIELRDALKEMIRGGVTVFISSHILSDLEDICSRVALIAEGRNARDPEGRTVLDLRGAPAAVLVCQVDVLGDAQAAAAVVAGFAGAHVMEAKGSSVVVELRGTADDAASLLRHLVSAGVRVARFDPRGPALEHRYRQAFGGRP